MQAYRARKLLGTLLCLLTLAGCARSEEPRTLAATVAQAKLELPKARDSAAATANLAYEHSVSIELSRDLVASRIHELQSTCSADTRFGCKVLEVSLQSADQFPSGWVKVRLAPAGVDPFIAAAARGGKITDTLTHAEDLSPEVTDNERDLSMLATERDRLAQFMNDRGLKVEQLITVSRELSSVQAQLESATRTRDNLRRRIDTELLTLRLAVPMTFLEEGRSPILAAFASFRLDMANAAALVIRFVAVLLPWLLVIVPGIVLLRLLWRAAGRWIGRREQARS